MKPNRGVSIRAVTAVIGVFGFVALMLYAVMLSNARRHSNISCLSNMHEIGRVMAQYADDYDQTLPPRQYVNHSGRVISWRAILRPYVKNVIIYRCPSNNGVRLPDIEHDGLFRSYAVNSTWDTSGTTNGPFVDGLAGRCSMQMISGSSDLILIVDSTAGFNDFNPLFPQAFAQPTLRGSNGGHLQRHHGTLNVAFADGHVSSLNPAKTLGDTQHPNLWTYDNHPFTAKQRATAAATLGYQ